LNRNHHPQIPKIQYVERVVQREIEQEIEVPRYVEVQRKHHHHRKHIVEQHQKTVEVKKEKIIEKIVERKDIRILRKSGEEVVECERMEFCEGIRS
jgi:hypothetical protein